MRTAIALFAACLLAPTWGLGQALPKYTISTVAGNGAAGSDGDGSAAANAKLNNPLFAVVDSSGAILISDQLNHKIRKVTPDGTISLVAGKGTIGSTGDGAAAASAELSYPTGIAVDKSGTIYFSDSGNNTVRKIVSGGNISVFAGNKSAGYTGDTEKAVDASLNLPTGLAVDSAGNVYIADTANNVIRKVDTEGKISTFAGTGAAGSSGDGAEASKAKLNRPVGLAMDASNNLFVADQMGQRIRKITSAGIISTVAGTGTPGYEGNGGAATRAQLFHPTGLTVDTNGDLIIADTTNNRIRKVTSNGVITTVAGMGPFGDWGDGGNALSAALRWPSGVAAGAAGKIYVVDNQNNRIRLLTPVPQPVNPTAIPVISDDGVISSAAFGAFTAVAPGSWIEIRGSNLAASAREWTPADFDGTRAPTALDGTRVTIGGQPAYIAYVSPELIRAQLPFGISPGAQELMVTSAGGSSAPYRLSVNAAQPGLNAPATLVAGGRQYVAATLEDGATFALPSGAIEGILSRPAQPGETITISGIGFGPVSPMVEAGEAAQQENALTMPFEIRFGDTPAELRYAGLAPGAIGVYQFKVVVPQIEGGEAVPISFSLDGTASAQALHIAVGNK
ncbi:MAG: SMP-30/gluconolactonase/LRE family protein [Acidobacteria bacterium]|nr:SMP-30/gluconolactonase/LRE family protein [Acidobacteriota bacterium]